MSVRLERNLQRACLKWARQKGWMALKVETIANVGWPDVVLVPPYTNPVKFTGVLWVEFKREDAALSPIQEHVQKELAARHQRVYTVRTVEFFKEILATYV